MTAAGDERLSASRSGRVAELVGDLDLEAADRVVAEVVGAVLMSRCQPGERRPASCASSSPFQIRWLVELQVRTHQLQHQGSVRWLSRIGRNTSSGDAVAETVVATAVDA